jgi:hypothetical protein
VGGGEGGGDERNSEKKLSNIRKRERESQRDEKMLARFEFMHKGNLDELTVRRGGGGGWEGEGVGVGGEGWW